MAKLICGRCSDALDCLEDRLNTLPAQDDSGVFGGTSPKQRQKSEVYTMVVYIKKRKSLLPVLIQEMQHSSYLTNHATPPWLSSLRSLK